MPEPTFARMLEHSCLAWNHFVHMKVTWMCVLDFWYPFKLIPLPRVLLCWVDIGFKDIRAWFAICDVKGIFTIFGCIPLFHLRLFDLFLGYFFLTSSHSKAYELKNIGTLNNLVLLLCKVLDLEQHCQVKNSQILLTTNI